MEDIMNIVPSLEELLVYYKMCQQRIEKGVIRGGDIVNRAGELQNF